MAHSRSVGFPASGTGVHAGALAGHTAPHARLYGRHRTDHDVQTPHTVADHDRDVSAHQGRDHSDAGWYPGRHDRGHHRSGACPAGLPQRAGYHLAARVPHSRLCGWGIILESDPGPGACRHRHRTPRSHAMIVPDIYPIPGILDRFLIWLWWSIVLGLGINLGVQLLLNPGNALDMLVQALRTRLQAVEASIEGRLATANGAARAGAAPAVSALALSGVASQLALLKLAPSGRTTPL